MCVCVCVCVRVASPLRPLPRPSAPGAGSPARVLPLGVEVHYAHN